MRKLLLLVLMFMSGMSYVLAQSAVTGTVTDENGEGIPGANIVIKGTSNGTITDMNGDFALNASSSDVLVVTYVGYSTIEIAVGSQSEINISLAEDIAALDEIVVTGYGTQERKEITSAVTSLNEEDFNKGLISNPMGLLEGKVAGLSITKPGGDPNGGYTLRLRGISTVGANASPLVVIDGVIGGNLDLVDPNDIESIDVIKDGAAAAIYGTRGSSGVILVTTKKGMAGTTKVEYNVSTSVDQMSNTISVMTAEEYRALPGAVDFGATTDWLDLVTRDGVSQTHNISVSGGTESTTYRVAVNYREREGILLGTGNNNLNTAVNLSQKGMDGKLTIDVGISYTNKDASYGFGNEGFREALKSNPTMPVYDPNSIYGGYHERTIFDYVNPVSIVEQNINEGNDNIFLGSLKASLDLSSLVEGLNASLAYTRQITDVERGQYYKKTARFRGSDKNGLAITDNQQYTFDLLEGTLGYAGQTGDLGINALVGYSYQEFFNEGYHAEGGDFLTDAFSYHNLGASADFNNGLGSVWSWANSNKLIAGLARVNLNYDDTYFLNASLRYEGSSRFGANNKWAAFYGVGAGVSIHNLLDTDAIDNLKLRVSYGQTGNEPGSSYISLQRFAPSGNFYYNGAYTSSYGPTSNANPDLAWEIATHLNVGVDFALVNSRLFGSVEYFTRETKDQLLSVNVPVPPNLVSQTLLNIGTTKNTGFEANVNFNVANSNNFKWTTGIVFGTSTSELMSWTKGDLSFSGGVLYRSAMGSPGQSGVSLVRVVEGETLGQIWGPRYEGINPDGTFKFADLDGDGSYCDCDDDREVIGNGLPDFTLGWNNTLNIGNLDISMQWNGEFGHDLFNSYRGFYENAGPTVVGNWNVVNTSYFNQDLTAAAANSSHVEDATYFELNNITVGYNLKDVTKFMKNLRVYVSAQRPIMLTGYEGIDPVSRWTDGGDPLSQGIERRETYFRARTFTLGLNITL